ncbi:MAG: tetratricopeptide repeat protein [Bacteroidota bacterium]
MRTILTLIAVLPLLAFGQSEKKAQKYLDHGNYEAAAAVYSKLVQKDQNNINYLLTLGECMSQMNNSSKAVEIYEKARHIENSEKVQDKLMSAYMHNGEFHKAIDLANKKIEKNPGVPNKMIKRMITKSKVGQTLMSHPVNVEIKNLGSGINSSEDDILPFVSADGQTLVFSSNRKNSSGKKLKSGNKPFEVFMAKQSNGEIKSVKAIDTPVNSEKTDLAVGFSSKGEKLYVFNGSDLQAGKMHDYEQRNGTYDFSSEDYENLKGYELTNGVTISEDLQEIYFASHHKSSLGGMDIYMSRKLPNGKWAVPTQLDETINTIYDESFPQLAQYDKYLYFSSDGHPGMGGRDLFKSKRKDKEWKNPVNLGFPLSTPLDDKNIAVNEKGNAGYISSVGDDSHGGYDIYSFEFKEATIKHAVMLVYLDQNGNSLTDVPLSISDSFGNEVGTFYANQNTKRFTLALKPGTYEISIPEDGFENYSEKIVVAPENLNKFNNEIRLDVSP